MARFISIVLLVLLAVGCESPGDPDATNPTNPDRPELTTQPEETSTEETTKTAEPPANPELDALRGGGFVIYLRHTETDASPLSADADGHLENLSNCSLQRNLTDAGRRNARELGEDIERLGVPVGEVLASPYCRTRQTAELAFGRATLAPELATPRYLAPGDPENESRDLYLENLLSTEPASGENTFVLTHELNLRLVSGESVPEGGAVVFEPRGEDGFEVFATLPPDWWDEAP